MTTRSRVYYQRLRIKSDIPGTTEHSRAYCQHLRVKKSNIPDVTEKDKANRQVLKWSGEDIVKLLNIYRNFEALWDTYNEDYEEKR